MLKFNPLTGQFDLVLDATTVQSDAIPMIVALG